MTIYIAEWYTIPCVSNAEVIILHPENSFCNDTHCTMNSVLLFYCNSGYASDRNWYIACNGTESWTHPTPRCRKGNQNKELKRQFPLNLTIC